MAVERVDTSGPQACKMIAGTWADHDKRIGTVFQPANHFGPYNVLQVVEAKRISRLTGELPDLLHLCSSGVGQVSGCDAIRRYRSNAPRNSVQSTQAAR